jgi:hypothetical protein
MPLQSRTYQQIKASVGPGDVIAFAGNNPLSAAIMHLGKADVSHVGIITAAATATTDVKFIEATVSLDGNKPTLQAEITDFPDRITAYKGQVWWLPLSAASRTTLQGNAAAFRTFVQGAVGRFFDIVRGTARVLQSPFDVLNLPNASFKVGEACFCSELVTEALEAAGLISGVDAGRVLPSHVCSWQLYDGTYALLKGTANSAIQRYNTSQPGSV